MKRTVVLVALLAFVVTASLAATQSQARRELSGMKDDLGTAMEQILEQMPDNLQPERRRDGEQRIFTYTFSDRSQLIFSFVPRDDGGRGLVLYFVDVKD